MLSNEQSGQFLDGWSETQNKNSNGISVTAKGIYNKASLYRD